MLRVNFLEAVLLCFVGAGILRLAVSVNLDSIERGCHVEKKAHVEAVEREAVHAYGEEGAQ